MLFSTIIYTMEYVRMSHILQRNPIIIVFTMVDAIGHPSHRTDGTYIVSIEFIVETNDKFPGWIIYYFEFMLFAPTRQQSRLDQN